MAISQTVLAELRTAAAAASDKLATDIVGLDVGERIGITDASSSALLPRTVRSTRSWTRSRLS